MHSIGLISTLSGIVSAMRYCQYTPIFDANHRLEDALWDINQIMYCTEPRFKKDSIFIVKLRTFENTIKSVNALVSLGDFDPVSSAKDLKDSYLVILPSENEDNYEAVKLIGSIIRQVSRHLLNYLIFHKPREYRKLDPLTAVMLNPSIDAIQTLDKSYLRLLCNQSTNDSSGPLTDPQTILKDLAIILIDDLEEVCNQF
jgi:hypothetical protein